MARKVLESCPSCGGRLEITEVHCLDCDARVQAHFSAGDFSSLTEEQSTFLRIFVTSRGNLSDVEKRLGVSYPTVRAKLDEIIARLETPRATPAGDASDTAGPRPPLGASLGASLSAEIGAAVRGAMNEVRAALDEARVTMSHASPGATTGDTEGSTEGSTEQAPSSRRAILDAVARGELTPTEGLERIRRLGGE